MNAVWIDQPGRSTMPSPGGRPPMPSRPRRRRGSVSAITHRSHTTRPSSSRRSMTSPARTLMSAPEDLSDRVDDGAEQNDEHGGEDEEDEREEDLDRRLLRPLLGCGAAALAHLHREVAHDLARRGAERLALEHRAHEGAHARRVRARQHPLKRFVGCQAHPLLLKRETKLDAERAGEALRSHRKGRNEAYARLESDHEQVDQLRQLVIDLLRALPREPV